MRNLLTVALLLFAVNMGSCQNSSGGQQTNATTSGAVKATVPADEFEKKLTGFGVQLIDVRTPGEFAGGHLNNALNIDIHSSDFEQQLAKLDKSKPVLVYCKAGGRSASAADKMQEMGFTTIYNLDGGIMKWEAAGKPLAGAAANTVYIGMTMEAFTKLVTQKNFVLVDYNAHWCAPCKKMLPVLEALADKKKDKLTMVKIDADENKSLLQLKNITGIPYLELYNEGKLVWKHEGFIEEADLLKETKL